MAHAIGFLLMMGLAAVNARGANLAAGWLVVPYLAYFTVAASRCYALPALRALWPGLLHLAYYVLVVLLPTAIVILATVTDWGAFMTWFNAA